MHFPQSSSFKHWNLSSDTLSFRILTATESMDNGDDSKNLDLGQSPSLADNTATSIVSLTPREDQFRTLLSAIQEFNLPKKNTDETLNASQLKHQPTAAEPSTNSIPSTLTLNVGGRHFRTLLLTIQESELLRNYTKDDWNWTPESDGSYFLDADPELFEHLLRYMRRPSIFPLFWSEKEGFNYDLYNRLGEEARFFGIDELAQWIEEKKYHEAVTITWGTPVIEEIQRMDSGSSSYKINEEPERRYRERVRRIYVCPRGIVVHRGAPDRCGAACAKALERGGGEVQYDEEPYTEVILIPRKLVFHDKICRLQN